WKNVVAVATFRSWRSSRVCPCMAPGRRAQCVASRRAQGLFPFFEGLRRRQRDGRGPERLAVTFGGLLRLQLRIGNRLQLGTASAILLNTLLHLRAHRLEFFALRRGENGGHVAIHA